MLEATVFLRASRCVAFRGSSAYGLVWIVGCDRGSRRGPPPRARSRQPRSAPGVTIRRGKDGRATVDGALLHGDSTLMHEVWAGSLRRRDDGVPRRPRRRRRSAPPPVSVPTLPGRSKSGSHIEAMSLYYARKGWGEYTRRSTRGIESRIRPNGSTGKEPPRREWRRFHAEQAQKHVAQHDAEQALKLAAVGRGGEPTGCRA